MLTSRKLDAYLTGPLLAGAVASILYLDLSVGLLLSAFFASASVALSLSGLRSQQAGAKLLAGIMLLLALVFMWMAFVPARAGFITIGIPRASSGGFYSGGALVSEITHAPTMRITATMTNNSQSGYPFSGRRFLT